MQLEAGDIYVVFVCGHSVLNPKKRKQDKHPDGGTTKGYFCPECKGPMRMQESWIQCEGEGCTAIIHRTSAINRERFCDECRIKTRNKVQQQRNEKLKTQSYEHLLPACTLDEIANEFGKTKEWARQEVAKAFRNFRKKYEKIYGEPPHLVEPTVEPWNMGNERLSGGSV